MNGQHTHAPIVVWEIRTASLSVPTRLVASGSATKEYLFVLFRVRLDSHRTLSSILSSPNIMKSQPIQNQSLVIWQFSALFVEIQTFLYSAMSMSKTEMTPVSSLSVELHVSPIKSWTSMNGTPKTGNLSSSKSSLWTGSDKSAFPQTKRLNSPSRKWSSSKRRGRQTQNWSTWISQRKESQRDSNRFT